MRRTRLLAVVAVAAASANVLASCTSDDSGGIPPGAEIDAGSFDSSFPSFDGDTFFDTSRPVDSNVPIEAAADVGVGDDAPTSMLDTGTPDEGTDTGVDAGVDTGIDSGADTGVDSGFDAGTDANDGAVAIDAGPTYTHFVYAVGANTIVAYDINESTGVLGILNETPDAGSTMSLPINNNPLALTIIGDHLYTANAGGAVSAFAITHGRLSRIASETDGGVDTLAGTTSRYVVGTSKFLFTANEGASSISRFAIAADGTLTSLGDFALPPSAAPDGLILDPTGTFLFSLDIGLNQIEVLKIDGAGGLTAVDQDAVTAGQQDFPVATGTFLGAAHPTLRTIYVSGYSTSTKVAAIAYDTNGILSAVGTPQTTGSGGNTNPLTFSVAVDPSGTHLYAVNYEDTAINVYTIDQATGALTAAGNGVFAPTELRAVSVDPSGAYLFVSGDDGLIASYAISGNTLTEIGTAANPGGGYTLPVIVSP
jgi:6-phosphogluconolactonase (cycloisomerase 2 family)